MKQQPISFKPLRETDLPLMHRWLNTPHVSEWWSLSGNHHPGFEEVEREYLPVIYGDDPTDCYMIYLDEKPIGMIQCCDLDDYPKEKAAFGLEGKCTSVDLFIGEEDYVHKGLGSGIIRSFLKKVVFTRPDVVCCVIDPYVENEIAIKAYKKAGFRFLRTVWYEADQRKEDIYIIHRDEIAAIQKNQG
jgi:aminoglycoside 6'-N-acetyltransferase